ncbi:hypothetical protein [Methylobacterium brachiatum]|uniref:hypothetical protein n=1 Tax=Methylobacterium brachiatum TaxID=269660 RepID=UPI000EFBD524|nr:hypothetical protein [Methylobacterium brachiatum]AYO83589.1 hypothetical protein EBB05_15815 [Methylobacterium brachiatum]
MIDFSMDEMLELARQAELQKRVEADGMKTLDQVLQDLPEERRSGVNARAGRLIRSEQIPLPEDLRGKLGETAEGGADSPTSDPS